MFLAFGFGISRFLDVFRLLSFEPSGFRITCETDAHDPCQSLNCRLSIVFSESCRQIEVPAHICIIQRNNRSVRNPWIQFWDPWLLLLLDSPGQLVKRDAYAWKNDTEWKKVNFTYVWHLY